MGTEMTVLLLSTETVDCGLMFFLLNIAIVEKLCSCELCMLLEISLLIHLDPGSCSLHLREESLSLPSVTVCSLVKCLAEKRQKLFPLCHKTSKPRSRDTSFASVESL